MRVLQDLGSVARDTVKPDQKPNPKQDIPVPSPAPVTVTVTAQVSKPSFKAGLSLLGGKSIAKFISAKDVADVKAAAFKPPPSGATQKQLKQIATEADFKMRRHDFLHRVHNDTCDVFGTVLGPEANDAHRDHFHLDMNPRRQKGFCQ